MILYPTDTIWGIGCDATNEDAVRRVYEIKRRNDSKSMLVLLDNPVKLQNYVAEVPEIAWDLRAADKPLTIIRRARNLAPNLIAPDGSVGIRITTELFSAALCKAFRKPVVSTSANLSGEVAPSNFGEIPEEIRGAVDYIVEYRQNETGKGEPSGIIKLSNDGTISIIRK